MSGQTLGELKDAIDRVVAELGRGAPVRVVGRDTVPADWHHFLWASSASADGRDFLLIIDEVRP